MVTDMVEANHSLDTAVLLLDVLLLFSFNRHIYLISISFTSTEMLSCTTRII